MNASRTIVGILVGGGTAPGIKSVISAARIRSIVGGCNVVGIFDGFKWLMEGSTSHVTPLSSEEVSRIHFRGGSLLGTSRANPTKKEESLEQVLSSLARLGITRLITIGCDDTMIRLAPEDLADNQTIGRCASAVGLSLDAFRERFRSIV